MALPLAAGVIVGGASLIGQAVNAYSAGRMNKRAERFSRDMYSKQRADSLSDWHMQNSYNDPSAQMARLKTAGLNPNLVYGNGADAQAQSAPRASNQSTPNYTVPKLDAGGVVMNALAAKQLQANIARTEAETQSIRSRTVDQDFKNELNGLIGTARMMDRYIDANTSINLKSQRESAEWEAYRAGAGNYFGKDSPAAKAAAAGFELAVENLSSAVAGRQLREAALIVKQFEANLAKQGISLNSPWYVKFFGDLLKEAGLSDSSQLFK